MPCSPRAPHVLYVAWGFPPGRSGGVYRALATANAFAAGGFRVTVLTAERETFERHTGVDPSLEALLDPSIKVERVPFTWPYPVTDRAEWSRVRRLTPRLWWRARVLLDQVGFPEKVYGRWRRPLERAAEAVHRRDPVDLVVATANPYVDFAAASHLKNRHGIPYVVDYRDAWLLDVFDGHQTHSDRSRPARYERTLLHSACEIWFVNEPIRRWHAKRYEADASRMRVVANGFDPDFAPTPRVSVATGDTLRFGYIGTVSSKVPLAAFAAGWAAARRSVPELAGAEAEIWGYLGFHTGPQPELAALVDRHAADGLSYAGPLPKAEVARTYARFDALLLILGAGDYVTSGKVYEYVASALPIVSVHAPGNAASEVLRDYPLWFPVPDLEPSSIAAALGAAARAARTADAETRERCREFGRQYARPLQLEPRVAQLFEMVSAKPG